ncbi:MAG TPA: hypothetical protein PKE20_15590, partial [Promineifilum sp.]|nr:hypothetical protein [Promineifilum sp.]
VCLLVAMSLVALLPGLAPTASAQCLPTGGHYEQRGGFLFWVPTPTPAKADNAKPWGDGWSRAGGWFRHEDGHIELWREGRIVQHAFPGGERWDECVATMPSHAKNNLGITPAPPRPVSDKPEAAHVVGDDPFPGGVNAAKLAEAPAYQVNGQMTDKATAYRAMQDGLADDSVKSFLTAVLSESDRKQFIADLDNHPALQSWKGKLHVNAYAPSDWHVSQIGLADGISYQGPPDAQGRSLVKFRMRGYEGPEALATALRESDKNYRPDADRDPAKVKKDDGDTEPGLEADPEQITAWGAGGLALLSTGILVLRRRYYT